MRIIKDHKVNGLNEAITIMADGSGPGGASHSYHISFPNHPFLRDSQVINFQNGPLNEVGINGITNEALLAILIDRMRGFQFNRFVPTDVQANEVSVIPTYDFSSRGQFACKENACALTHLEEALMWLQKRTRDRMGRGVEGTHKL